MSIEYAILGLLSYQPLAGYDIKKIFESSPALYWSGNNNQIYTTLVALHKRGLVSRQVQQQELHPARKVYAITEQGRVELERWTQSPPELPQVRHGFLLQLAWAGRLPPAEMDALLEKYENEVWMQTLTLKRQAGGEDSPRWRMFDPSLARSQREARLWRSIQEYWMGYFENELNWVRKLREELKVN